jgi:hypothetical protein
MATNQRLALWGPVVSDIQVSLLRHAARSNTGNDVLEAIVYFQKFFRANLIFGPNSSGSLYSLTRASQRNYP